MDTPRCTKATLRNDGPRDSRRAGGSSAAAFSPGTPTAGYSLIRSASLYPSLYCWLLLVATLDILLTWVVLHLGGSEVNGLAAGAIELAGHWGLIAIKFAASVVVVSICEYIGRRHHLHGRRLAEWSIALWTFPVVFALAQLAMYQG